MEYKWRKDGDTAMTSSFVALEIGCIVLGNSTLDTFIV